MVLHCWIEETLSTLKAASNITNLICNSVTKSTTNLESNETSGSCVYKHPGPVSINRRIFQGDNVANPPISISPLLLVMALIPLTVLLQKTNDGYCFRNKTKVNHLLYMDDLELFGKSKNDITSLIHTVRISSEDIRIEFGIYKCALLLELEEG